MPVERITDVVRDLLYGTMFTNYFAGSTRSVDDQAEDILDIVFHGILSPAGTPPPGPGAEPLRTPTALPSRTVATACLWPAPLLACWRWPAAAATGRSSPPAKPPEVARQLAGDAHGHRLRGLHRPHRGRATPSSCAPASPATSTRSTSRRAPRSRRATSSSRSTRGPTRPRSTGPRPTSPQAEAQLKRLEARLPAAPSAGQPAAPSAARSSTRSPATAPRPARPSRVAKAEPRPRQAQPRASPRSPRRSRGRISRRMVDPGNLVKADDTLADDHRLARPDVRLLRRGRADRCCGSAG